MLSDHDRFLLGLEPTATLRACKALHEALQLRTENTYYNMGELPPEEDLKQWPSTLDYIETQCGGFYGMSVIVGEKGAGKTMLCIASAIEAAASGNWQVVYLCAEDDIHGFAYRFNTYVEAHPSAADCFENFHFIHVGKGQDPASLTAEIFGVLDQRLDIPLLVCMDSINSIVNLGSGDYLKTLKEFGIWAMLSRRISGADVSWMITSETNKSGNAKGEALPFWADVVMRIKSAKDSDVVVMMDLVKSRRTSLGPSGGAMGKLGRNVKIGRFEPEHFTPRLVAVDGGGGHFGEL